MEPTQLGPIERVILCPRKFKVSKMLTLIGCLCCVGFTNLIGVVAGVQRQTVTLSMGGGHLRRFHLKTEKESSLRNVAF
jgi:hypothetical protein